MAFSLSTAGLSPATIIMNAPWTGALGKINRLAIRFVFRGNPSSGTLRPVMTANTLQYGIYMNTAGDIVIRMQGGLSETVNVIPGGTPIVNVEHHISLEWYETVSGTSYVNVFYFGALVYSFVVSTSQLIPNFNNIGHDATGVRVDIEVRGLFLDGTTSAGWLSGVSDPYRYARAGENGSADWLNGWASDYGANLSMSTANMPGGTVGQQWKVYDPSPLSGTQSLLMGTNVNELIRIEPSRSLYVNTTQSTFYETRFKFCNLYGNTMGQSTDKIGILTDESGLNGFFISSTGSISVYMNGVFVLQSVATYGAVTGATGIMWHDILISVDTQAGTVTIADTVNSHGGEVVSIPAGFNNLIYPPSVVFNTIGYQKTNSRSYTIKFYRHSHQGFGHGSYDGIAGVEEIVAHTYDPHVQYFMFRDEIHATLQGYKWDFSPWVYELEEYPIQTVQDDPVNISVEPLQEVAIPRSVFGNFFVCDNPNISIDDLSYAIYTSNGAISLDPDYAFLRINASDEFQNERVILEAVIPSEDFENAYVILNISATHPGAFSDDFQSTGFYCQVAAEDTTIIRVLAFNTNAFDIDSYEGLYEDPVVPQSGIQRWNGSVWELISLLYWDGTDWVNTPVLRWDGGTWVGPA